MQEVELPVVAGTVKGVAWEATTSLLFCDRETEAEREREERVLLVRSKI